MRTTHSLTQDEICKAVAEYVTRNTSVEGKFAANVTLFAHKKLDRMDIEIGEEFTATAEIVTDP